MKTETAIQRTKEEQSFSIAMEDYFSKSTMSNYNKLCRFTKYVPRQVLSAFLVKNELFKMALDVHGSIVECGVYDGNRLMTWAHLSAIYEPYNYQRRIIGFDTFEGFPELTDIDKSARDVSSELKVGGFAGDNAYEDLMQCIKLYDMNRPLSHIPKIELVKGDASITFTQYLEKNPHLIISLLYLDFDIYKPTKAVLEQAISRIPKGGIIAFDEINNSEWPGETMALVETLGINNLRIKRFPYEPVRSYAIIE